MKTTFLYIATVLIWGSTWLAIEFQLGAASIVTSLFLRFLIAAVAMWAICFALKTDMHFTLKNHAYILLLACLNFSMNYVLIYQSQQYLTSAMTCIVFSTMLLMNIVNTKLFFGDYVAPKVYMGAALGIAGLGVLFWHDLSMSGLGSLYGLAFGLVATLTASFGNMVSVRNSRASMNVLAVNAWGMLYGAIILAVVAAISGAGFSVQWSTPYVVSLLYLAIFGTVIAFCTYYMLLHEMGPEKASYTIVLFPLVALVLSSLFEDFIWSANTLAGFALVLIGNAIVLIPQAKIIRWLKRPQRA